MQWKFYLGACLLAGALLVPHTTVGPVVAGMILARVIQLAWWGIRRRSD